MLIFYELELHLLTRLCLLSLPRSARGFPRLGTIHPNVLISTPSLYGQLKHYGRDVANIDGGPAGRRNRTHLSSEGRSSEAASSLLQRLNSGIMKSVRF